MTEAEWLACVEPEPMIAFLQFSGRPSERKLRLFACACCRRIERLLTRESSRQALAVAEQYADGLADRGQLREALTALRKARSMAPLSTKWEDALTTAMAAATEQVKAWDPTTAAQSAARAVFREQAPPGPEPPAGGVPRFESADERRAQCDLLRDVFNPFRPVTPDRAWLLWNGGAVVRMARAAYDGRAFDHLPVLADALEEAGCANADLLGHLRGPGPHVPGCWALDLLLGRE